MTPNQSVIVADSLLNNIKAGRGGGGGGSAFMNFPLTRQPSIISKETYFYLVMYKRQYGHG